MSGNRGAQNPRNGGRNRISLKPDRSSHPPPIANYDLVHNQVLRFTATAAAAGTAITFADLLDTIAIATTTTAGFQLFDTVRVRLVEVWAAAALGTASTVSVEFTNTEGDSRFHTDTSLGVSPAYLRAKPSKDSTSGFWHVSGAGSAFVLTVPAGSIIDVHLSFRGSGGYSVALQVVQVAATAGTVFWRGLDGIAIATTNFPPPAGVYAR
jgi:hypothetical protein